MFPRELTVEMVSRDTRARARGLKRHRFCDERAYMTKGGFADVDTLTNIPSFRHRQDLNPGGSRMEIYETISHVSTNQVWLHINSASPRVYFRPFALFSFVARRARANLPEVTCLGSLTFVYSRPRFTPSFATARHPPFLHPYSPYTWYARYS